MPRFFKGGALLALLLAGSALAQQWYDDVWADPEAKKKNTHSGNLVQTTFYNTALVGRVGNEFSFEWPKGTGDEYIGDISVCVGVEYFNKYMNRSVRSVAVTQSPARGRDEVNPADPSEYWTFMPLPGFANPDTNLVAMSHQQLSWPNVWPDKGWPGSWNGYFGRDVNNADQESYFWVDDSRDMEFMRFESAWRDSVDRCTWREGFPGLQHPFDPASQVLLRVVDAVTNRLTDTGALQLHWFDLLGQGVAGDPEIQQAVYGETSDYMVLPAGSHELAMLEGTDLQHLATFDAGLGAMNLAAGGRYTFVVHGRAADGSDALRTWLVDDRAAGAGVELRLLNLDLENRSLRLLVDGIDAGVQVGRLEASAYLPMEPGRHRMTIVDGDGTELKNGFVCLPDEPGTYSLLWYFGQTASEPIARPYLRLLGDDPEDVMEQRVRLIQPFADDSTHGGLGLKVAVRGFQWSHALAEDVIFWLYDITNTSDIDYDKVVFGMVCGTLVGGDGDSGDDINDFDLAEEFTYTSDSDDRGVSGWVPVHPGVRNVGIVGYAFLESPGNRVDWIDNDGDSKAGPEAPRLTESKLVELLDTPRTLVAGETVVAIDYNDPAYPRYLVNVPQPGDTLVLTWRNIEIPIYAGATVVENSSNLIDDNFNGVIDESRAYLDAVYVDWELLMGASRPEGDAMLPVPAELVQAYDLLVDERRDDGIDNDGDWDPEYDDLGADGAPLTGDTGEGDGLPTHGEPHFDELDITESDQLGLTSFNEFTFPEFSSRNDNDIWARMVPGEFGETSPEPADHDFLYGSGYFPLRAGETQRVSLAVVFGESVDDIFANLETVRTIYNENYNFIQPPDKPTVQAVAGDGRVTLYWDDRAEKTVDRITNLRDFEGYRIYRATDPGFLDDYNITDGRGNAAGFAPLAQFDLVNEISGFFPIDLNGTQYYLGSDTGLVHSWTDTTAVNGQNYFYAVTAYDSGDEYLRFLPAETAKQASIDIAGRVTLDVNTVYVQPAAPGAGYRPGTLLDRAEHVAGTATGSVELEIVDETQLVDGGRYEIEILPDTTARIQDVVDWVATDWGADTTFVWNPGIGGYVAQIDSIAIDSTRVLASQVRVPAIAWTMRRQGQEQAIESFVINVDTPQQRLRHPGVLPEGFVSRLMGDRSGDIAIRVRLDTGDTLDPAGEFDFDFDEGKVIFVESFRETIGENEVIEAYFEYQYNLVHKQLSPNLTGYGATVQRYNPVVEGLRLNFVNDWTLQADPELSGWLPEGVDEGHYDSLLTWGLRKVALLDFTQGQRTFIGQAQPHDYRMEFVDGATGATSLDPALFPNQTMGTILNRLVPPVQTNYRIWDVTDPASPVELQFFVYNAKLNEGLPAERRVPSAPFDHRDAVLVVEADPSQPGSTLVSWLFQVSAWNAASDVYPAAGDRYVAITMKPFTAGDHYAFTVGAPDWDPNTAADQLALVKVVPNPYLTAASWEKKPIKGNRGDRKIQFTHMPPSATVRIYTIRGELVQTLHHDAAVWDGTLDWNLKTFEGLDVAYGVYLYHLDSPAGEKTGKFALIK